MLDCSWDPTFPLSVTVLGFAVGPAFLSITVLFNVCLCIVKYSIILKTAVILCPELLVTPGKAELTGLTSPCLKQTGFL